MRLRLIAAAVAVPLAVASLAACGESALQKYAKTAPATIDKDARAALTSLKSVHMEGTIDDNGSNVALNLTLDTKGNCVGSISNGGQKVSLIGVNSKIYVQAGASFWESAGGMPAATAALYATKWVTGQALSSFGQVCNLTEFGKSTLDTPIAQDKPAFLGTAKINGIDVVNIQVQDKAGNKSTLSVDANAPHNIIRVVGARNAGTVTFTKFNVPVTSTAPAGAIDVGAATGSN